MHNNVLYTEAKMVIKQWYLNKKLQKFAIYRALKPEIFVNHTSFPAIRTAKNGLIIEAWFFDNQGLLLWFWFLMNINWSCFVCVQENLFPSNYVMKSDVNWIFWASKFHAHNHRN